MYIVKHRIYYFYIEKNHYDSTRQKKNKEISNKKRALPYLIH